MTVPYCRLLAKVREEAGPLAIEAQLGFQPRGQRAEQLARELIERRGCRS
jgi:hypothetical protein